MPINPKGPDRNNPLYSQQVGRDGQPLRAGAAATQNATRPLSEAASALQQRMAAILALPEVQQARQQATASMRTGDINAFNRYINELLESDPQIRAATGGMPIKDAIAATGFDFGPGVRGSPFPLYEEGHKQSVGSRILQGGITAAATGGLGSAAGAAVGGGLLGGAVGGATTGASQAALSGQNVGQGALTGAVVGGLGSASGALSNNVANSTGSNLLGNAAGGALQGAGRAGLNGDNILEGAATGAVGGAAGSVNGGLLAPVASAGAGALNSAIRGGNSDQILNSGLTAGAGRVNPALGSVAGTALNYLNPSNRPQGQPTAQSPSAPQFGGAAPQGIGLGGFNVPQRTPSAPVNYGLLNSQFADLYGQDQTAGLLAQLQPQQQQNRTSTPIMGAIRSIFGNNDLMRRRT